ncbi:MAG TPA: cytochrome P450 [Acidimicrobiales bacterium]|nr:cytochrome P450 [Acidimicrobiales bacterium]
MKPTVDLDHHSAAYAADPVGTLHELRAACPVGWSPHHGGFWALTRYDDVTRVLNDAATFSSRHDLEPDSPFKGVTIPPPPMQFIPVEMDPPEFMAYRRLLNPMFSPAAVERLRPTMLAFTDSCIDAAIERGSLDLVYDLASPVPAMVTLELLGLPSDEWRRYSTTFHDMAGYPPGTPQLEAAFASAAAITADLAALVAARRADAGRERRGGIDDLIDATVEGAPIPDDRLVDIIKLILAGGIDTTTGAAAGAFVYLAGHPAARRQLAEQPALLETAVEEFVRWVTPTPVLARTATCPVTIGGEAVGAHERVMANLFAANRDPSAFACPDDVVLDRSPNRHASFGFGIHRCVGANLARVELQVMLSRVLGRIPDYEIDLARARRYPTAGVQNGWVTLPATLTTRARPPR